MAVMGAVVAQRTTSHLLDILPDALRARLPDGWLESMVPSGSPIDSTVPDLPGGAETAEGMSGYFATALGGALDDAFVVGGVVAALAIASALLLRGETSEVGHHPSMPALPAEYEEGAVPGCVRIGMHQPLTPTDPLLVPVSETSSLTWS